jgi:hypothetical protein
MMSAFFQVMWFVLCGCQEIRINNCIIIDPFMQLILTNMYSKASHFQHVCDS